jgi:hypothetical protein
LVRGVQAIHLLGDLVFEGLCHNEVNAGPCVSSSSHTVGPRSEHGLPSLSF